MRLITPCTALMLATLSHTAHAQTDDDRDWRLDISGGITTFAGDQDQPYVSASLRHSFGDIYVSLGGVLVGYDGPAPAIGDTIPATTRQAVIGIGYETDALGIDAYVAFGDRDFDSIDLRGPNGTPLQFEADGSSWATGAAITYQAPLGGRWFLAPFLALDYSEIDTVQALVGPTGEIVGRRVEESGVTGSGGGTLQYALGQNFQHSLGLYAAFVTTSNAASTTRIGGAGSAANAARPVAGADDGDSWFEYGASASFGLSDAIFLDLFLSRTAGLRFGDATSASIGLSFEF
ncbi:autotransporter domain-containing protein [Parasphingopyxis sp.]|uniref:autotransporter domain-containing protein n=1 Tax=Parasphingopyxis sp. TaxID=1920299 RepID=UPI00260C7B61|nr:autotransporter domain-containing protein [Parasphingopyxis sp.]